jgi:hypothetical protein
MAKGNGQPQKTGEDYAREMMVKGLFELRDAFSFQGSNIAQPNWYGHYNDRDEKGDEGRLIDRDFDEQPGKADMSEMFGREPEQDRDDRDDYDIDMDDMER